VSGNWCPACWALVARNSDGRIRQHRDMAGFVCSASGIDFGLALDTDPRRAAS
jgi:hypothetical protein